MYDDSNQGFEPEAEYPSLYLPEVECLLGGIRGGCFGHRQAGGVEAQGRERRKAKARRTRRFPSRLPAHNSLQSRTSENAKTGSISSRPDLRATSATWQGQWSGDAECPKRGRGKAQPKSTMKRQGATKQAPFSVAEPVEETSDATVLKVSRVEGYSMCKLGDGNWNMACPHTGTAPAVRGANGS